MFAGRWDSCGGSESSAPALSQCEDWCDRLRTTECPGPTSADDPEQCSADCQHLLDLTLPSCEKDLSTILTCLDHAFLQCVEGDRPPEGDSPAYGVTAEGCRRERLDFEICGAREREGSCALFGSSFTDENGDDVSVDLFATCDCVRTIPGAAGPGEPCVATYDCAGICCPCPEEPFLTRRCVAGRCADETEACADAESTCDLLSSLP